MKEGRVSSKQAAEELHMDVLTLRGLMQIGKINIGYALKKPGKTKYGYVIYRNLLDQEKERLFGR